MFKSTKVCFFSEGYVMPAAITPSKWTVCFSHKMTDPLAPPVSKHGWWPHGHQCWMGQLAATVECRQTNWSLTCRKTIEIRVPHSCRHEPNHSHLNHMQQGDSAISKTSLKQWELIFRPSSGSDLNGGGRQRAHMLIDTATIYYDKQSQPQYS